MDCGSDFIHNIRRQKHIVAASRLFYICQKMRIRYYVEVDQVFFFLSKDILGLNTYHPQGVIRDLCSRFDFCDMYSVDWFYITCRAKFFVFLDIAVIEKNIELLLTVRKQHA